MIRASHIIATVSELAHDEIRTAIGEAAYSAIRSMDQHPCFLALEVGEEGISTGAIAGHGNAAKVWGPAQIQELAERMQPAHVMSGPEVYEGHTNGLPRQSIGKVVGSIARTVAGKAKAFAVAYLYPRTSRDKAARGELDTCSIEAALDFIKRGGSWIVNKVMDVSGLALASRKLATPGFANATILATVQELESDDVAAVSRPQFPPSEELRSGERSYQGAETMATEPIKLSDVKAFVVDQGITPEKVFDKETLLSNALVVDAVENEAATQVEAAKTELQTKLDAATTKLQSAEAKLAPLEEEQQKAALDAMIAGSELLKDAEKGKVAFLQQRMQLDTEAIGNAADDAAKQSIIDQAIKSEIGVLDQLGASFTAQPATPPGVSVTPAAPTSTTDTQQPTTSPAGAGNMDPATNPLIPQ